MSGATGYHVQRRIGASGERWSTVDASAMGTTHTVSGLWCGRTHEFRVGAHGDGATYNARLGLWSTTAKAITATCSPLTPRFHADSHSFEISALASVGDQVGTVSAFDLNDDPVTCSISAGNEAGKFSTGEITLAARLGSAVGTTHTLTVGAADGMSGTTSSSWVITTPALTQSSKSIRYSVAISVID